MEYLPAVSVIVPIYNVEKYIGRCVRSLFEQTLDDIEYIFVNDCTPDRSMDILRSLILEYPARANQIKIVEHNENQGSAAVRNSGLKVAVGEYIIHCDSDDWVERHMYEAMYSKAVADDSDMVVCSYFAEYGRKQVYYPQLCPEDPESCLHNLLVGKLHNGLWNKLIRRELYHKLSFWWTAGINMWEDVSVMNRLAFYSRKPVFLAQAYYHYSQINTQAYTHCWSSSSLENVVKVVDIVDDFFRDKKISLYAEDLLWLKVRAKYSLLQYAPAKQRKIYRKIYPGADSMVFSHPALPVHGKIMMWCWIHSWDLVAWMIMRCIALVKKWLR